MTLPQVKGPAVSLPGNCRFAEIDTVTAVLLFAMVISQNVTYIATPVDVLPTEWANAMPAASLVGRWIQISPALVSTIIYFLPDQVLNNKSLAARYFENASRQKVFAILAVFAVGRSGSF